MATLKASGDVLCQCLNLSFFPLLDSVVVEAREYMFLVHLFKPFHLPVNTIQPFSDFVLDIEPAWGEYIHLNDSISIVFKGTS